MGENIVGSLRMKYETTSNRSEMSNMFEVNKTADVRMWRKGCYCCMQDWHADRYSSKHAEIEWENIQRLLFIKADFSHLERRPHDCVEGVTDEVWVVPAMFSFEKIPLYCLFTVPFLVIYFCTCSQMWLRMTKTTTAFLKHMLRWNAKRNKQTKPTLSIAMFQSNRTFCKETENTLSPW